MPCYHPLIGIPTGQVTENGKESYYIRKACLSTDPLREVQLNHGILIPCGHCIGCRLDYSRHWADRMMLELDSCGKGIFVTLTYDNDHAHWSHFDELDNPVFATLDKRDCQLFMKRLRKRFSDLRIRFYLAGEYGEKTLRPHYHAILFGIGLTDISDLVQFGRNELGQNYYISETLQETWSLGHVLVSDVSWKTCAYVARYITKKLNGSMDQTYAIRNVIKEFSLMSRKPGIGADYLSSHPDCLDWSSINLSTPDGVLKIQIPKYYLKKLELSDKEKYDNIMESRRKFASDKMLLELSKTDLSFLDYLEAKEEKKKSQIKILKRK